MHNIIVMPVSMVTQEEKAEPLASSLPPDHGDSRWASILQTTF